MGLYLVAGAKLEISDFIAVRHHNVLLTWPVNGRQMRGQFEFIEALQESVQAQNVELAALKTTVTELTGSYLYLEE